MTISPQNDWKQSHPLGTQPFSKTNLKMNLPKLYISYLVVKYVKYTVHFLLFLFKDYFVYTLPNIIFQLQWRRCKYSSYLLSKVYKTKWWHHFEIGHIFLYLSLLAVGQLFIFIYNCLGVTSDTIHNFWTNKSWYLSKTFISFVWWN